MHVLGHCVAAWARRSGARREVVFVGANAELEAALTAEMPGAAFAETEEALPGSASAGRSDRTSPKSRGSVSLAFGCARAG